MSKVREKDIAIIGLCFNLPGGDAPESFWNSMLSEQDCICKASEFRESLNISDVSGDEIRAGFVKNVDRFDAAYFNILPQEAAAMDPRQRMFLEIAVSAADIAGYGGKKLWGSDTGVFVGTSGVPEPVAESAHYVKNATHYADSMIANRVSDFMNLKGPSKITDSLCSSTLAAIHEACQSLRYGECKIAIAGGINLILSKRHVQLLSNMKLLSYSGKTKTFDEKADGFALGEGAGAFVLKPLKKAIQHRDFIWAVVKGSAVNHNGRTGNMMMPHAGAVAGVVEKACKDAEIDPKTISFIETTGTGAPLADAVEIQGLKNAFKKFTTMKNFCGLGAVKTRIGNMESASGVGALVKTILSMKHKIIPKNLNCTKINPLLNIEHTPFFLCNKTIDWHTHDFPLRAGINALGIGGTNSHIIIEHAPANRFFHKKKQAPAPHLLCLSARTIDALKSLARKYLNFINSEAHIDVSDMCLTHNMGRAHFPRGISIMAYTRSEIIKSLKIISELPEYKWSELKNLFFKISGVIDGPDKKNKGLSDFRNHYTGGRESEKYPVERFSQVVFVVEHEHLHEAEFLKSRGIIPEYILKPGEPISDAKGFYVVIVLGPLPNNEKMAECFGSSCFIRWPRETRDETALTRLVAQVYGMGAAIDFEAFYSERNYQKVPLPSYAFERKKYPVSQNSGYAGANLKQFDFLDPILNKISKNCSAVYIEKHIAEAFSQTLIQIFGCAPYKIKPEKEFKDYGINSIITIQLLSILESRLGIQSGPLVFSRHPSIKSISAYLASCYKDDAPIEHKRAEHKRAEQKRALTKSLTLVDPRPNHLKHILGWLNDPEINQWLDPFFQKGLSPREIGFFVSKKDKFTYIIVYDSRPVGICGLIDLDVQNQSAETWLVIGDERALAHAVGFAAGIVLCKKAFYELNLQTLVGKVRIDNEPALSMMRYKGWRRIGVLKNSLRVGDRFYNQQLFQLTRSDFESKNNYLQH
jgi:3-oxoacyl-(acyl-carrier-protein) synthase/RimJ/RimL family protein N-acetyltransferase/acyl carrier protein